MRFIISLLLTFVSSATELPPLHEENKTAISEHLKKKDTKKYSRLIYMKLPLLQPEFHWIFSEKGKFLAGALTMIIESENDKLEVPIFAQGVMSRNWEAMDCNGKHNTEDKFYFGFISKKPYLVSETDKVYLNLKANFDLEGRGADMEGTLKKGIYVSNSQFKLYHLEEHTGEKDIYAFLNNSDWNVLWKLEETANKGWMEDEYNKKSRIKLDSHKGVYSIELDFEEGGKIILSVVDHKAKEYFYEHFKSTDDLVKYLNENKENVPDEIKHQGLIDEATKEYLARCKEIEEKIKPVKFAYEKTVNYSSSDREKQNINFMSKYKQRSK